MRMSISIAPRSYEQSAPDKKDITYFGRISSYSYVLLVLLIIWKVAIIAE